jgi:hypothetical protein
LALIVVFDLSTRGSGPSLPAKKIFFGRETTFSEAQKTPKKQTDAEQREALFSTKMRIAPPHRRNFTIDLQWPWTINRKIGDRQGMSSCFRHALTIAVLLFFL